MRIAVLVYGRLAKCADHYTSLLDSLGPGTVEFFMSSDASPQPHLDAFLRLYKPIAYTNAPITYTCDLGRYPGAPEGTNIHNMTCHFINKWRVFSLLEAHVAATQTTYDVVVSLRIDLLIRTPFPFGELVDNTVYIPEGCDFLDNAINDRVAYGKLDAMKLYNGIVSTAEILLHMGLTIPHPESLTLANILFTGLAVKRFPLTYSIERQSDPQGVRPETPVRRLMPWCIVYLASPRSVHVYDDPKQPSRLDILAGSIRIARKLFPDVDLLVFHEDYTIEDMARLPGVTQFHKVDFSGQEAYRTPNLRRPYGYLMMCRFFSGQLQAHPALSPYTHYMRLDDDSYFIAPYLTQEHVETEYLTHDYVYRSTFGDLQDQQSLWEFTLAFLRSNGYGAHIETLKAHLRKKFFLKGDLYSGLAPYNNFHVSSLRFWQNDVIQRYLKALEDSHGILKYGWMDANIHAMMVYVLTLFVGMKMHNDTSFGYRHNSHVSQIGNNRVDFIQSLPFGPPEAEEDGAQT